MHVHGKVVMPEKLACGNMAIHTQCGYVNTNQGKPGEKPSYIFYETFTPGKPRCDARTEATETATPSYGHDEIDDAWSRSLPSVLLLMGLAASGELWGNALCHKLAAAGPFRVIRYDSRDTGRSTKFTNSAQPNRSYTSRDNDKDGASANKSSNGSKSRSRGTSSKGGEQGAHWNDIDDLFDASTTRSATMVPALPTTLDVQPQQLHSAGSAASARSIWQIVQALRNPSHPPLPTFYHIDDLASDALLLLRAMHLDEGEGRGVHLVGYCMGGMVAQCIVIREPALVRSLTLIATHTSEPGAVQWPSLRHMLGFMRFIPKEIFSPSSFSSSSFLLPPILSKPPDSHASQAGHKAGVYGQESEASASSTHIPVDPRKAVCRDASTDGAGETVYSRRKEGVSAAVQMQSEQHEQQQQQRHPIMRDVMDPYIMSLVSFLRHISGDQKRYPFDTSRLKCRISQILERQMQPQPFQPAPCGTRWAQSTARCPDSAAATDSNRITNTNDSNSDGSKDTKKISTVVTTSTSSPSSTHTADRGASTADVTNVTNTTTGMSQLLSPLGLLQSILTHVTVAINAPGRDADLRRTITSTEPTSDSLSADKHAATPRVYIPTLILHGTRDIVCPPGNATHLAEVIPGSKRVMITGMGHTLVPQLRDEYVGYISQTIRQGEMAYKRRYSAPVLRPKAHL